MVTDKRQKWLGEKDAANTLTLSAPNNVTSEMGLALPDVADVIRPHPEVVAFLQGGRGRGLPGRFEQGRAEAEKKEQVVLEHVRARPDGERKADATKRMIDRSDLHRLPGVSEDALITRFYVYKQALMEEAERLVQAHVFGGGGHLLPHIPGASRRRAHQTGGRSPHPATEGRVQVVSALTPPRVLTSEGEGIAGAYRRDDVPTGALVGLPVSAGMVEGRASRHPGTWPRRIWSHGDILVTAYTDPSWSPLFIAVAGLVTEVGGLMTHGAVIRAGAWPAHRRRSGACDHADPGWAADPACTEPMGTSRSCCDARYSTS